MATGRASKRTREAKSFPTGFYLFFRPSIERGNRVCLLDKKNGMHQQVYSVPKIIRFLIHEMTFERKNKFINARTEPQDGRSKRDKAKGVQKRWNPHE